MTGMLDVAQLESMVHQGEIDTVLCALPDLHGRLVGKRVMADYFLDDVLAGDEGLHASLYLFAVDMDMEPLPGYELTGWDSGFSDFTMKPDLSTLRLIPWLGRTALVICDAWSHEDHAYVAVSPRQILQAQIERAHALGFSFKFSSELEFYLFRNSYEDAWASRYRDLTPHSHYRADYHILQTTKYEDTVRQIREGMSGAGIPVIFSKGEWGLGQQEINLRYHDALTMADQHIIYKNGVKEIAALNGISATFMAKWAIDDIGSSFHVHSSLWSADGSQPLTWEEGRPYHLSEPASNYVAGLMAGAREMTLMCAPNVNSYKRFQSGSFAPTTITWGQDNRTCSFRLVGERKTFRVESRIPGADANPYLTFAATIASALHGIENRLELSPINVGNAYDVGKGSVLPTSLRDAIDAFREGAIAREAFGEPVFRHVLNTAVQELDSFNHTTVTDWEKIRYFERG